MVQVGDESLASQVSKEPGEMGLAHVHTCGGLFDGDYIRKRSIHHFKQRLETLDATLLAAESVETET